MSRTRNGALVGIKLAKKIRLESRRPESAEYADTAAGRLARLAVSKWLGIFDDPLPLGFSELMVINYDYFNEARVS